MIAATVRVHRPSGALDCFEAETCSIDGDAVHVTVRHEKTGEVQRYTWPLRRVLEIRWREGAA